MTANRMTGAIVMVFFKSEIQNSAELAADLVKLIYSSRLMLQSKFSSTAKQITSHCFNIFMLHKSTLVTFCWRLQRLAVDGLLYIGCQ
jgi:hypothetical protein